MVKVVGLGRMDARGIVGKWMKGRPFGLSELQTSTLPKMCLFVDDALTKPSEFN